MKRKLLIITLSIFTLNGFAQKKESISTKAVKENSIIIEAYYGFPYWWGTLLTATNNAAGGNSITDVKVKNTNHIGGRFEYMVSDKIGIGAEYTYADASATYKETTTTMNGSGVTTTATHTYTDGIKKQRALVRMGIHFGESATFDPYICIGAGYKGTTYYSNASGSGLGVTFNVVPVATRFGGGFRYFFTENIGINIEAGLGGPLVQGGLSLKL